MDLISSERKIDLTDFEKLDLKLSWLVKDFKEEYFLSYIFPSYLCIYFCNLLIDNFFYMLVKSILKYFFFKRYIPKSNSFLISFLKIKKYIILIRMLLKLISIN